MPESLPTLLLVEDNEEDAFILQRALRRAQITCNLQIAQDGQQAIDYISGAGQYADRNQHPIPALILLDLKLPYVNGFEFLGWLSGQPYAKELKIIILTSSGEDGDRGRADQFGIHAYFVKPPTAELMSVVSHLLQSAAAPATK